MTLALPAGHSPQHTHIEAIRAGQQGYIEIGAIAGDPDDIRHKRYIQRWFFLTGDNTAELLQIIDQLRARHGNVYSSRVLYQQPRRDKALALPTHLLFLDDAPPGSYTYTVETSPQSMHAYILLDELISPDQAEQLGRRLAYQQGADQGGWDITQLVRVPGTLNTKTRAGGRYDDKRRWIAGTGHQITFTKRTGRAYKVDEIIEATQTAPPLPIDALDASSVAAWHGNIADLLSRDGLPRRWKNPNITGWKVLRGEIQPKSSSEARYHIIASLVLHGYPDDEIAALALHLTDFGKMHTKGSEWLYRDIARCTRKARTNFAEKGKDIVINPTRPGRTRAPVELPRKSPAHRGRKCKGSPATYYTRLLDEASGDRVLWTLSQAAAAMGVGVATIKRWEVVLKAQGQIERVTVSTRQHSYVAILGQLKIHESASNQAPSEVSSQITVQRVLTPSNKNKPHNTWENHRGLSQPPLARSLAPSLVPVAAPSLLDDLADDLADASGANREPLPDDLAEAADASFVPLPDDLADASGAGSALLTDDQAEAASASCVPLADVRAGKAPPRDELVCGAELRGPAGAFVVAGGAAYVPAGAETWYAGICAAVAPLVPAQADEVAGAAQLVAALDDLADAVGVSCGLVGDDLAEGAGVSYERAAEEIASAPARSTRRRRKSKDPKRKKLDERRRRIEGWRAMDLGELLIERGKLAGASHDHERSPQQRQLFANMLPQIDEEIGRKRSAAIQAMYQAANASTEPPSIEQTAPAPGIVRRCWRSAFVPFDTPTGTLPPREVVPRTHPIAELGTNPESMRAAHEYCERIMAKLRVQGET